MKYNLSETLRRSFEDFLTLFFPKLCVTCNAPLTGNETLLCTSCKQLLPETNFHPFHDNPVAQIFWGRIPVERATSLLFFDKGSKYRKLVHHLKYKDRKDIGLFLGNLLGARLQEAGIDNFDAIVPIPLHIVKQRRRGYNQSKLIADGIAEITGKQVVVNTLRRAGFTTTQTKKGRFERWQNVENIFVCVNQKQIENKHILLVDDVITTGATLEAAGSAILSAHNTKLSIATIAYAHI